MYRRDIEMWSCRDEMVVGREMHWFFESGGPSLVTFCEALAIREGDSGPFWSRLAILDLNKRGHGAAQTS